MLSFSFNYCIRNDLYAAIPLQSYREMSYPAAELRGIKKTKTSFRQSLSRNPIPYEKTLDSRPKDRGNDKQRSILLTPKQSFEEFFRLKFQNPLMYPLFSSRYFWSSLRAMARWLIAFFSVSLISAKVFFDPSG